MKIDSLFPAVLLVDKSVQVKMNFVTRYQFPYKAPSSVETSKRVRVNSTRSSRFTGFSSCSNYWILGWKRRKSFFKIRCKDDHGICNWAERLRVDFSAFSLAPSFTHSTVIAQCWTVCLTMIRFQGLFRIWKKIELKITKNVVISNSLWTFGPS
jgi:hypothetical protein